MIIDESRFRHPAATTARKEIEKDSSGSIMQGQGIYVHSPGPSMNELSHCPKNPGLGDLKRICRCNVLPES